MRNKASTPAEWITIEYQILLNHTVLISLENLEWARVDLKIMHKDDEQLR